MWRFFVFLLGFSFTLMGLIFVICYLNLITIGYNFKEYLHFISRKFECLQVLLGILLMSVALYTKKGERNELYL